MPPPLTSSNAVRGPPTAANVKTFAPILALIREIDTISTELQELNANGVFNDKETKQQQLLTKKITDAKLKLALQVHSAGGGGKPVASVAVKKPPPPPTTSPSTQKNGTSIPQPPPAYVSFTPCCTSFSRSLRPAEADTDTVSDFFEQIILGTDNKAGHLEVMSSFFRHVDLDYGALTSERGLVPACAVDGSLGFLTQFFSAPLATNSADVQFDVEELLSSAMFNQQYRIPLMALLLKHSDRLHLDRPDVAESVQKNWQDFIADIASKKRAIPREDRNGRMQLLERLLLNPHIKVDPSAEGGDGLTVFARAALEGDLPLVDFYVQQKLYPPINQVQADGTVPIMQAVIGNVPQIVKLLLQIPGIDLTKEGPHGTAMSIATTLKRDPAIAAMLKEKTVVGDTAGSLASSLEMSPERRKERLGVGAGSTRDLPPPKSPQEGSLPPLKLSEVRNSVDGAQPKVNSGRRGNMVNHEALAKRAAAALVNQRAGNNNNNNALPAGGTTAAANAPVGGRSKPTSQSTTLQRRNVSPSPPATTTAGGPTTTESGARSPAPPAVTSQSKTARRLATKVGGAQGKLQQQPPQVSPRPTPGANARQKVGGAAPSSSHATGGGEKKTRSPPDPTTVSVSSVALSVATTGNTTARPGSQPREPPNGQTAGGAGLPGFDCSESDRLLPDIRRHPSTSTHSSSTSTNQHGGSPLHHRSSSGYLRGLLGHNPAEDEDGGADHEEEDLMAASGGSGLSGVFSSHGDDSGKDAKDEPSDDFSESMFAGLGSIGELIDFDFMASVRFIQSLKKSHRRRASMGVFTTEEENKQEKNNAAVREAKRKTANRLERVYRVSSAGNNRYVPRDDDERDELEKFFVGIALETDADPNNAALVIAMIRCVDLDFPTVAEDAGLVSAAAADGSVSFFDEFLDIPGIRYDTQEVVCCSMFNEHFRIRLMHSFLSKINLKIKSEILQSAWQEYNEFFVEICSKKQCLMKGHKDDVEMRMTLIDFMLHDPILKMNPETEGGDGLPVFSRAAHEGDVELIERLIAYNAVPPINRVNSDGTTALVHAVYGGNFEVLKAILKIPGIDVNFETPASGSAYAVAVNLKRDDRTIALLEKYGGSSHLGKSKIYSVPTLQVLQTTKLEASIRTMRGGTLMDSLLGSSVRRESMMPPPPPTDGKSPFLRHTH